MHLFVCITSFTAIKIYIIKISSRVRDIYGNVTKKAVLCPVSCSARERIGKQTLVYTNNILITESTSSGNDVNLILFSTVM